MGLIFIDEVGHRRDYTFSEISAQSQRYAAVLRAFGVEAGERVALCASNTAKSLFALLALERLGATGLPCPQAWTGARIAACVRESGATTVIANRKHRERIDELRGALPLVQKYVLIGEEHEEWARLDALAERAQPYAGTADQPQLSAIDEIRERAQERFGLVEGDRFWYALPMDGAPWFENAFLAPWSCGACAVIHEGGFEAAERLELLRELEVTVLLAPAADYETPAAGAQIRAPRLRRCLSSGEVAAGAAARWNDTVRVPIEPISL